MAIAGIDRDLRQQLESRLEYSSLQEWSSGTVILDYGTIIICRKGSVDIYVNFKKWHLLPGSVITLFPNDVVMISEASDDFEVERLVYDQALLREASLQLEHTVYQVLRDDRCRNDTLVVTAIIDNMFALLRVYFEQEECTCVDQLVVLQLKSFFLGFYEYINRNPLKNSYEGSRRVRELFNEFMHLIEQYYKQNRDVTFYARELNITPKYLNNITTKVTGHSSKTIIDHFVVLQLKLTLRNSNRSIKEIAHDYHFSDLSFFSRYFRLHTGKSPQLFRKEK